MLGKPSWFARRKYTGWGFTPKTWQGWVYFLVIIAPIVFLSQYQSFGTAGMIFMIIWAIIFCLDFIHIIINLKLDERERIHEAIAERNALWVIVIVLGVGVAFQAAASVAAHTIYSVDPFILIALGTGIIAKIISNIYLDLKN